MSLIRQINNIYPQGFIAIQIFQLEKAIKSSAETAIIGISVHKKTIVNPHMFPTDAADNDENNSKYDVRFQKRA